MLRLWFRRLLLDRGMPQSIARPRTDRRPSPIPAMIEFLEPRQMPSAAAVDPTTSPADVGIVNLDTQTGEWQSARFDGEQFVSESLTTWNAIPEEVVTVQGDLWGTGQKQLIQYEPATGMFAAEWKAGSAVAKGTVAGWVPGMDLQFLTAQDLNHDGFDDLIGMDRATGKWAITTFQANASQDSRFVTTWRTDINWQHVNFGDLNADGWDDIVGYNPADRNWTVSLGGPSEFQSITFADATPSGNLVDVQLAKFDGKSGADILYRNSVNGNWTAISLVSGQLRSQVVGNWSSSGTWVDVQTIDFWGIGREAIIGRNTQTNGWELTWSVGSGFTTSPIYIWSPGDYADAFVADLNHDGREDLVARQVSTGNWFSLSSSPTSIETNLVGTWNAQSRYDAVEQGDFNGDLRPDWIGLETGTGIWRGMISVGTGGYTTMTSTAPAFGYVGEDSGVADYDLDGHLDVFTRDRETGNRLLVSVVNGALTTKRFNSWTGYGERWTDPLTIDFNGDGDNDLLARDAITGQWWLSTFLATTPTTQKIAQWSPSTSWQNRITVDFDGNGSTDVLDRDLVTGNWHLLRMVNGVATSAVIANWSPGVTWTDFQVADLLGNGRPMILARNAATNLWQGLWSSGSGFTTSSLRGLAAGSTYVDTRVVHFFSDQRETVVTRDQQTGAWYALWYSSGRFNLTSLGIWDPGGNWEGVAAADLEGNGREALYGHDSRSGQTWRLSFDGTAALNTVVATSSPNVSLRLATVGHFTDANRQSILMQEEGTGRWYRFHFNGLIYSHLDLGIWSETQDWTATSVGDFNRDGRDDLFGHGATASAFTTRSFDGSNWTQLTAGSFPASATVTDVAGASNTTLRATILADIPELAAAEAVRDIAKMAELLRNWVANAANAALYSDPLMEGATSPAEAFYGFYARDRAGSSCGGISEFYVQVLSLFQIDSLTVGLGDYAADLTHTTVVVPIANGSGWRFVVYDPTFNCSFANSFTNSTATYFDIIDAARSGYFGNLSLNEQSNDNRQFVSSVPVNHPSITLERVEDGVYVYRWPGYGIGDYLETSRDTFVSNGYSTGLSGFFQLFPQVKVLQANNGSGNVSTSNNQRTAFLVELASRGIAVTG